MCDTDGAAVDEVRVADWNELNEQLYKGSWQQSIGRFRSNYAFRGMPDASYDLTTTLMRLGGAYDDLEEHLLRTFRRYARRYDTPRDSIWNWLAVAQHHSLPTRMLDWTYSPYVALHFATADLQQYDADGVVWCVDYAEAKRFLPPTLREILDDEGAHVFTSEMLDRAAATLRELQALSANEFVIFFEPPSFDDRIVNQHALFTLMSSAVGRLDRWLADKPALYRRIIIPAELKWEVRDKLDQANITERVLFPGLDGLSAWLARYYSPGPNRAIDGRAPEFQKPTGSSPGRWRDARTGK